MQKKFLRTNGLLATFLFLMFLSISKNTPCYAMDENLDGPEVRQHVKSVVATLSNVPGRRSIGANEYITLDILQKTLNFNGALIGMISHNGRQVNTSVSDAKSRLESLHLTWGEWIGHPYYPGTHPHLVAIFQDVCPGCAEELEAGRRIAKEKERSRLLPAEEERLRVALLEAKLEKERLGVALLEAQLREARAQIPQSIQQAVMVNTTLQVVVPPSQAPDDRRANSSGNSITTAKESTNTSLAEEIKDRDAILAKEAKEEAQYQSDIRQAKINSLAKTQ